MFKYPALILTGHRIFVCYNQHNIIYFCRTGPQDNKHKTHFKSLKWVISGDFLSNVLLSPLPQNLTSPVCNSGVSVIKLWSLSPCSNDYSVFSKSTFVLLLIALDVIVDDRPKYVLFQSARGTPISFIFPRLVIYFCCGFLSEVPFNINGLASVDHRGLVDAPCFLLACEDWSQQPFIIKQTLRGT